MSRYKIVSQYSRQSNKHSIIYISGNFVRGFYLPRCLELVLFYGPSWPLFCLFSFPSSTNRYDGFFKWANPGLFFIYFRLFKHALQFLQQINVNKCPSSIRCRDSNSQPLEHESPPITTRPGLPPYYPMLIGEN